MSDKNILEKICNDMASGKWEEHWSSGSYIIRPSGNPLTLDQNNQMRMSEDLKIEKEEMLKINSIEIYGDVATACFTVHQIFNYKGNENDDISVILAVFKKEDNKWKMKTGSRSQGRSPSTPLPEFN